MDTIVYTNLLITPQDQRNIYDRKYEIQLINRDRISFTVNFDRQIEIYGNERIITLNFPYNLHIPGLWVIHKMIKYVRKHTNCENLIYLDSERLIYNYDIEREIFHFINTFSIDVKLYNPLR